MKSYEEIMEILEAFALTNSYRAAGELAGCSHHTVEHWVTMRDLGLLPDGATPLERVKLIDGFMPKIEEWVERSNGKVRGDVVFDRLVGLGFTGSARTARRGLASVKLNWRAGRRRVYRPWVVEPGMWAQWDWGHGPKIAGRQTYLFCAWLAWCRFRVVLAVWDKTLPTVIACLDRSMRAFGGVPTYWLTDNERTVSTGHIAGIAVRHPLIVAVGHHYGVTVTTCVPADPETKGGVERTVQIAKADLVPTDTNLRDDYTSWAELVDACAAFMDKVNGREHRVTRRAPVEMLAEEQARLHRPPNDAFTAAFGETRSVTRTATISFGGVTYSVPHTLIDQVVWVRVDGDEIVATHLGNEGSVEVARHLRSTPGNPRIDDAHYPPRPAGALAREPRPGNPAEAEFLGLGDGARMWLVEAAAAGTPRVKVKMAEAVQLALLHGVDRVDWALGHAANSERFADGDVASILAAHPVGQRRRADDAHSMQPSTRAWESFGEAAS
ncbi:MAG: IS21 family transposase [Ilumatobacteraceae bacterium]|nr:IS21 family transposase [Ilumatobacteraceae bacterium]